jgi:hypothetical protein
MRLTEFSVFRNRLVLNLMTAILKGLESILGIKNRLASLNIKKILTLGLLYKCSENLDLMNNRVRFLLFPLDILVRVS